MHNYKIILGIETSCDETAAAVLKKEGNQITVLSSIISSSAELQATFGGVIPEQAAREQLKAMIPVISEALKAAFPSYNLNELASNPPPIDAIAVTQGPGLIGSLLVGVETAKTLSLAWNKPLLPVNHLIGHYYANWIDESSDFSLQSSDKSRSVFSKSVIETDKLITDKQDFDNRQQKTDNRNPHFPCIGLLVSGGHTDLVLFKSHNNYQYLGGTRDDAAGECFDKCARLLGFPYPGGPMISKLAKTGDPKKYPFSQPMSDSGDYDFSFSGLKTAFLNKANQLNSESANQTDPSSDQPISQLANQLKADLSASLETTIVKSIVNKTLKAAKEYKVNTIIVGGGVSANQKLREQLTLEARSLKLEANIHFPDLKYCGDNAAMIAAAAFFTIQKEDVITLQANPNLSL